MRTLFALLVCSSVCGAQSVPAPAGYHVHRSIDAPEFGRGTRVELLEDERLDAGTRPVVESAYSRGEGPCDSHDPLIGELCSSVKTLALRPAIARLVGATGTEVGRLTLERATADVARLAVSQHDSVLAVTVDLSAGIGSYSGPLVRFLSVTGNHIGWTQVVDDATRRASDLSLPSTLKTGWLADANGNQPEILLVACRPDFDHAAADDRDANFVITYSRLYMTGGQWHRVERRTRGCWEASDDFPERLLFP